MMPAVQIFCIGVNHETAPVAVREGLSCLSPTLDPLIRGRLPQSSEWVLLSTCNRVELYAAGPVDATGAPQELRALFCSLYGEGAPRLEHYVYEYSGAAAVQHLLRVAAGLDSMVLGEPQILGQVTQAFSAAVERGTCGPTLTALFRTAIRAGKRVRSETAISQSPASVPSVAIAQARETLGNLSRRHILLVGAGAMAHTAVKALRARGYTRISVANRTRSRAEALVAGWSGDAYGLDELDQALHNADVAFCATHAQQPVLTRALLAEVQERRQARPLLLFDLAVPRDIEPGVGEVPGVSLVDLDRLRAELDESLVCRRMEVPAAERILAEEEQHFANQLAELAIRPVIAGLRQKAETIRRRELSRTLRHLGPLDEETINHINHLSRALVNQLLHEPTKRLREEAAGGSPEAYAATVSALFNLEHPGKSTS